MIAMTERKRSRARAGALAGISIFLTAGLLAACETTNVPPAGTVGHVQGFFGDVAGDEPQAVEVARQVLSAGGSATDAAVALDFTLAVTLPSRASLGAGGMCLVYDHTTQKVEALDFTPRASSGGAGSSPAPVAIPGNARAMFALHSKYGRLAWEQVLAPAEKLARNGTPISKPLGHDLVLASGVLAKDPEAMRIFGRKNGSVMREGDAVVQADLSVLIERLRGAGPGEMYDGMLAPAVARRFSEAGEATASSISSDDLRDYQPDWKDPITVAAGDDNPSFAPPPTAAGAVAADMWLMLSGENQYKGAQNADRLHLFAEASMRAFADRARWLDSNGESKVELKEIATEDRAKAMMASYADTQHTPAKSLDPAPIAIPENPAATSFVVVDRDGSAVVCALTMNNLFGLGRVARGTGIVAATAPVKGSAVTALMPMLVLNHDSTDLIFAAGASGGAAAPAALMMVALETVMAGRPLSQAMVTKRVLQSAVPDMLVVEKGFNAEFAAELTQRKHKLFEVESLGLVNAVFCPRGLPKDPDSCTAASDPRGSGRAFGSQS